MSRYNNQKRATLDRMTFKHNARMIRTLSSDASNNQARQMLEALDNDADRFDPARASLPSKIETVFNDHREDILKVGISDGIREITPSDVPELSLLNTWEQWSDDFPIEETLSISLASERDKFTEDLRQRVFASRNELYRQNIRALSSEYLQNIKNVYLNLSEDWQIGESSIQDVLDGLKQVLGKTDIESRRIFRTETTSYFNETRQRYFQDNTGTTHFQIFAVTDGRISDICETRHNFILTVSQSVLKKFKPAFHPNCRTILRPLMEKLKRHFALIERFGEGGPQEVFERNFAPLSKNWAA